MKDIKNIRKNGGTSMNLKRITALLAALALAASMAACQTAPAEPDATPSDSSTALSAAESTKKPSAATGTKGSTASSGKDAAPADEPTESSKSGQKETTPGSSSGSEKPTSGSQKPTEKPQQPTEKPSTGSKPSESTKPTEPKPTTPPHQHSYKTTAVAATCTTGGYTLHECSCGASYKDGQTAALGHSYVDTVVAPTTSSQGYTEHTCSRCGDSYKDSYTDPVRWDTEEVVARICAQGNEYVRSLGLTVDPSVGSWAAPESTSGWYPEGTDPESWFLGKVREAVDYYANVRNYSRLHVTYGSNDRGGWYIYVMYGL